MKKINILLTLIFGLYIITNSQTSIDYVLVKNINTTISSGNFDESSSPGSFVKLNDKFLFVAKGDEVGVELFISDGTTDGTFLLKNINTYHQFVSDPYDNYSYPNELTNFGNNVIFEANDDIHWYEPWITDGTTENTKLLKDIIPESYGSNSGSNPTWFTMYNEKIYFSADNNWGTELWVTDGTEANTYMLKNISTSGYGSSEPNSFYEYNNLLYFSARDSNNIGFELWRTDGTEEGTIRFKDMSNVWDGSHPSNFIEYNGKLFFSATGDTIGNELWVSDGTPENTILFKDINPVYNSSSTPGNFTILDNKLYFTANDGITGTELWCTNGDTTYIVKDIYGNYSSLSYTQNIFTFDHRLYFSANYADYVDPTLWVSDGTEDGTYELLSDDGFPIERPTSYIEWNNSLFFIAQEHNTENFQLWNTDGQSENTVKVFPNSSWNSISTNNLFLFNNEVYLSAKFNDLLGFELYKLVDNSSNINGKSYENRNINIFPNPTIDILNVQIKENVTSNYITIYNSQGLMLKYLITRDDFISIDLSGFQSGVYFIVVKNNKTTYNKSFIKY